MTEGGLSERSSQESKLSGARLLALRVWTVVGAIIIGVAVLNVLGILAPVIEFLAVGSLIAFVESPIVNTLERRGVPRGAGALLGLIVVVAVISCLIMVIGPMIVEQVLEVLARLPNQLRGLGEWVVQLSRDFEALSQSSWASQLDDALTSLADMASGYITQIAGDVGRGVFPFVSAFASQLFIVFLGLVLAYWLALDYPRIHREIGAIVGGEHETSYQFMVAILSRSVGGYMRSMVITSLVNGVLAGISARYRRAPLRLAHGRSYRAFASYPGARSLDFGVRGDAPRVILRPDTRSLDAHHLHGCPKPHRQRDLS